MWMCADHLRTHHRSHSSKSRHSFSFHHLHAFLPSLLLTTLCLPLLVHPRHFLRLLSNVVKFTWWVRQSKLQNCANCLDREHEWPQQQQQQLANSGYRNRVEQFSPRLGCIQDQETEKRQRGRRRRSYWKWPSERFSIKNALNWKGRRQMKRQQGRTTTCDIYKTLNLQTQIHLMDDILWLYAKCDAKGNAKCDAKCDALHQNKSFTLFDTVSVPNY